MCISVVVRFSMVALAALLWGTFLTQVSCFSFNFSSFPNEDHLILSTGNSNVNLNSIQVTRDVRGDSIENISGRVFYDKPFRLWNKKGDRRAEFNTTFVLNISNQTEIAGEGLAFVLTDKTDVPENSDGQWISIVNASINGTPQANIVAIEFDTRKSYSQDIDNNHVGLDVNTINSIKQVPLSSYGVNLSTGNDVTVHVQYNGKNITVFAGHNNTKNLVMSEPIDLSAHLPEKVSLGFAASTSIYTQLNCVKSWEFYGSDIGEDPKLFWVWIVVVVVVVVLLVSGVAFYLHRKRRYKMEQSDDTYPSIEKQINDSSLAPRKFHLRQLKKATDKFDPKNKLGRGGFGTVYKGTWKNKAIAVKRVSETSRQGKQEFIAEVTTIGSLRHRNLVKLMGWCYENREFLLVYEYMPNGSLDKFIFHDEKTSTSMGQLSLNWEKRVSIIHGTALALDYLHNGCEKRVLHRDIKASNIMLDSEFNAKLGDFGLARTIQESQKTHHSTKEIAGTPGYMAPETFLTGRATVETDVYAFGVLILEVACGRKPGNQNEQNDYNNSIVHWLWELHRKGRIVDAADSRLEGKFPEEEMECVLVLGLACCHPNPHLRPSMKLVLQVLSGEAPPPQVPIERPSFVWPAVPPSFSSTDYSLSGSQLTPFSDITGR